MNTIIVMGVSGADEMVVGRRLAEAIAISSNQCLISIFACVRGCAND
jgi:hypothetical protein